MCHLPYPTFFPVWALSLFVARQDGASARKEQIRRRSLASCEHHLGTYGEPDAVKMMRDSAVKTNRESERAVRILKSRDHKVSRHDNLGDQTE